MVYRSDRRSDHKKNSHLLIPALVLKYGKEQTDLAEKTLPLPIPQGMRLVALVSSGFFTPGKDIDVGFDITDPDHCHRLINYVIQGKWTSIRLFYVAEHDIDRCRMKHNP